MICSLLFTNFVSKIILNNFKTSKIEDGARPCPRNIAFINCINSNALKTQKVYKVKMINLGTNKDSNSAKHNYCIFYIVFWQQDKI